MPDELFALRPVLAMLAYGVFGFVRGQRMAVIARSGDLVVRNIWRSHRLDRADVAGFCTGRYQRVGHRTAYADLRSGGSVRLMALDPPIPWPGRERAVEPTLDRLESWRAGAPHTPTPPS